MSIWTHVAGIIRVDAMRQFGPKGSPTNPDLASIIGPMSTHEDWDDDSTIPSGSEGGLEYRIIENQNKDALSAYTVSIWSDLRDFDSATEIEDWLIKTFDGLVLRNVSVCIEVEQGEIIHLTAIDGRIARCLQANEIPPNSHLEE